MLTFEKLLIELSRTVKKFCFFFYYTYGLYDRTSSTLHSMAHGVHHSFFGREEAFSSIHTLIVDGTQKQCGNVNLVGIVGVNLRDSADYMPFQIR